MGLRVDLGLVGVWARREERRRQFVQQRLHALAVRTDTPIPQLSLRRALRQAASLGAFIPKKIRARLDAAFQATGNRIPLLDLPIVGSILAAIVIVFFSRMLALKSALCFVIGF